MSKTTVETVTCDRCGKEKTVSTTINNDKQYTRFNKDNVFHYNIPNPTNGKEHVDLCDDCFKTLKNTWTSFIIGEGF